MDYSLKGLTNRQWLVFFILISIIFCVGVYSLLFNEIKKDQAVGWKTYENGDGKFSLSYPSEWKITTDYDGGEKILILEGKEGSIKVNYGQAADANGVKDFMNNCRNKVIPCENTQFNGVPSVVSHRIFNVLQNVPDIDSDIEVWNIYPPNNQPVISILVQAYPSYLTNRDIILKVLSTFKFTIDNFGCGEFCIKSFSPDKKYTLLDRGTSPVRSFEIMNTQTQKRVAIFTSSNTYIWLGDEFIFNEPIEFQNNAMARPWGGGEGSNISKMILSTGEKVVLLKADNTHDYSLEKNSDNSVISSSDGLQISIKTYAPTGGDERFMNPSVQHWIMDSSGKLIKNIDN
jgi:hypothetical protein